MANAKWLHSACVAGGILALLTVAATAAAPSDEDAKKIASQLFVSAADLQMDKNPAAARKACIDAQAITKKFDPDPFWTAQIEYCFASVDDFQRNVASACQHYRAAAVDYDQARRNPKASYPGGGSTETELKSIGEAYARLKCPGTIPTASTAKMARPPGTAELNDIIGYTVGAMMSVDDNDPAGVKKSCDDAEAYAARFEPDPYVAAIIDACYGDYESMRKNKVAACGRYAKAVQEFGAVPKTHKAFGNVASGLKTVRETQAKLGC